jgi:hypothetical protein
MMLRPRFKLTKPRCYLQNCTAKNVGVTTSVRGVRISEQFIIDFFGHSKDLQSYRIGSK